MIKDLKTNTIVDIPLVVLSATARETKSGKPYLVLELYDGVDKIVGNYWDWTSGKIPEKSAILDVHAQVTEWQGAKQLNVKSLSVNNEFQLSDFEPRCEFDIKELYCEAYSLLSEIRDDTLRTLSLACLEQMQHKWLTAPAAKGVHHAFVGGMLVHSLSVAKIAKAIAETIPEANTELCIVGGFLHDIGKLFSYKMTGLTIDMTSEGMLYEHLFIGAEFIGNFAEAVLQKSEDPYERYKVEMLRHIIVSHHGRSEYGAIVSPQSIEAHIVHSADDVDAKSRQVIEASNKLGNVKWTERVYGLGNTSQLTVQYVQEIMADRADMPFPTEEADFGENESDEELPFK